jgi:DNA-binding transcriptional regulator YiaG
MTTDEMANEQVEQLYEVFLNCTESMTPHDAVENLRMFGADESIIKSVRRSVTMNVEGFARGPELRRRTRTWPGSGRGPCRSPSPRGATSAEWVGR